MNTNATDKTGNKKNLKFTLIIVFVALLTGCSGNQSQQSSSNSSAAQTGVDNCPEIKNIAVDMVEVLKPLIAAPSNSQNVELAKIAVRLKQLPPNEKTQSNTNSLIVGITNLMTAMNANDISSATKTVQSMTTDIQQLDAICNG